MILLKKKKIKLFPMIFKIILAFIIFYFVFLLISQQNQINLKKRELNEINNNLVTQNSKNNEIKDFLNKTEENNAEYLENLARKSLDLVKKGERVFINISGN